MAPPLGHAAFFVVLVLLCRPAEPTSKRLPTRNALVIVADDAGFESSIYGNEVVPTPSLQRLASRGVVYTNAFVAVSSCSSSRSVLLSGLPPHQNGMYGLHHDIHHFNSFDAVQTLPNLLSREGIYTGIVGKKHVGPKEVYQFDYEETEENNPTKQVGRNITNMKILVQRFLDKAGDRPFFLYIGFHDPHRCRTGHFGGFCERFGNGEAGMGDIADWTPVYFDPEKVVVPYFVPNTSAARRDIAAQYTVVNRMDQGIGLFLDELAARRLLDDTLVLFTSDNGIPFPSGRTNLYDPGMRVPFVLSAPPPTRARRRQQLVSLFDVVPTLLDWFGVPFAPRRFHKHATHSARPLGRSLLRARDRRRRAVFASHSLHEISMYYPIRVARSRRFKLIHNLAHRSPFPIDQDFYASLTYQDLLNRTRQHEQTFWYKDIRSYYYRDQFELFDVRRDRQELHNLAKLPKLRPTLLKLKRQLHNWMNATDDPWLCAPSDILEPIPAKPHNYPVCLPLYNDE